MNAVDELQPCPFCGGEPNLTHDHYVHDDLSPMPVVECKSCSAWVRVEDWNRRSNPLPTPEDGKSLVYSRKNTRLREKPKKMVQRLKRELRAAERSIASHHNTMGDMQVQIWKLLDCVANLQGALGGLVMFTNPGPGNAVALNNALRVLEGK